MFVIIGICAAGAVLIIILIIVTICCCMRKSHNMEQNQPPRQGRPMQQFGFDNPSANLDLDSAPQTQNNNTTPDTEPVDGKATKDPNFFLY